MDFRVLGPLSVEDERGVLALDGARVRALLAFLLLHANTAVSTADLLDELWGEDLPKSGATAVQNAVARLRKVLGERVVTTPAGYLVKVEPGELDLASFRELVERASAAEPGLEPGPALRELERAILRQEPELDAPARPAPAEAIARRSKRRLVPLV